MTNRTQFRLKTTPQREILGALVLPRTFLLGIVCVLILSATPVAGQSPTEANGFQPNRDYLALQPFESIDTASGNLILHFTDLALPSNAGRALTIERTFNNTPAQQQWWLGISGLPMRVTQPDIPPSAPIDTTIQGNQLFAPYFSMADGSYQKTVFAQEAHAADPTTTQWVVTPQFWKYDRQARTLYLPDGTVAQYHTTVGDLIRIGGQVS